MGQTAICPKTCIFLVNSKHANFSPHHYLVKVQSLKKILTVDPDNEIYYFAPNGPKLPRE